MTRLWFRAAGAGKQYAPAAHVRLLCGPSTSPLDSGPRFVFAYRKPRRKLSLGGTMTRQFDVVVEKDSDGYFVASVPALPGCHTQAKSLDELMERVREAIALCLEVQGGAPDSLDFVGVQRVTVNS